MNYQIILDYSLSWVILRSIFRTLLSNYEGAFLANWKALTAFVKIFISDVWQGSEYTSDSELDYKLLSPRDHCCGRD